MSKHIITKTIIFIILLSVTVLLTSCSSNKKVKSDNGFDISQIDTTVNPAEDFYDYAVGEWIKRNPIPKEYSRWGTFEELAEKNNQILKEVLEEAAADKNAEHGSAKQKIGDFYFTGMDTVKIEKEGYQPIKKYLDEIDNIKSKKDFQNSIAKFHKMQVSPLFRLFAGADAKNSNMNIAQLNQGGLGLPDRDYYLKDDPRTKEIREKYVEHISNMFKLIGVNNFDANKYSNAIMKLETRLAKAAMPRVEMRDPNKTYHKMTLKKLVNLSPGFDWENYFGSLGLKDPGDINVRQPEFFKEISKVISQTSLDDLKVYLKWNLLRNTANYLSSDFVNESFNFGGKFLSGLEELRPRWKRVLAATNGALGEALGEIYVAKVFPPESKQRAKNIVNNLLKAMGERIKNLDWMSEKTKEAALKKLSSFTVKIGYPDKWKDYSKLEISRDSYLQNAINADEFDFNYEVNKIGKPVDRTEWGMYPQTVNAYYSGSRNEIVFPAAILQPPFFNPNADDAINYGAMGAVIGHEITHGFDDSGRKYDAEGNLTDWWTKEDGEKFNQRAQKIIDQFNAIAAVDTFHINGKLTTGENIADLGGLSVALTAFRNTEEFKSNKKIDGFTPLQRFFFGWAQVWRNNIRDKAIMLRLKTDPHSPGKYRVNAPLSNMPEFWEAFNVKPGAKMRMPEDKLVKIW